MTDVYSSTVVAPTGKFVLISVPDPRAACRAVAGSAPSSKEIR